VIGGGQIGCRLISSRGQLGCRRAGVFDFGDTTARPRWLPRVPWLPGSVVRWETRTKTSTGRPLASETCSPPSNRNKSRAAALGRGRPMSSTEPCRLIPLRKARTGVDRQGWTSVAASNGCSLPLVGVRGIQIMDSRRKDIGFICGTDNCRRPGKCPDPAHHGDSEWSASKYKFKWGADGWSRSLLSSSQGPTIQKAPQVLRGFVCSGENTHFAFEYWHHNGTPQFRGKAWCGDEVRR